MDPIAPGVRPIEENGVAGAAARWLARPSTSR